MNPDALLTPLMIVDDSANDVTLLAHRLQEAGVRNTLLNFRNAEEAFKFLKPYLMPGKIDDRLPCAMFLDVNLPGPSGFHLLTWMRQQPAFAQMKIFVLSGAGEPSDAQIAITFGANKYFRKFPEPAELARLLANVCEFVPAVEAEVSPFRTRQ